MSGTDFTSVTEVAGLPAAEEQVARLARRYHWAGDYCAGKDVLEVGCGSAPGVGYLGSIARNVVAGDYSADLLKRARDHYGDRFRFLRFDAQQMPFAAGSFDVVMILEALYYIPDAQRFFRECRRVLRPEGMLLIATANKDLYDFNRSPHSHRYLGVLELVDELRECGFDARCFGDTPVQRTSLRQRLLRPAKAMAAKLNLIPKSMHAKTFLRRLVFGPLTPMPAEIDANTAPRVEPGVIGSTEPDRTHKVIFCAARAPGVGSA